MIFEVELDYFSQEKVATMFVKYVLHALYGQFYAFPILSQNGNEKSWTAFCGLLRNIATRKDLLERFSMHCHL